MFIQFKIKDWNFLDFRQNKFFIEFIEVKVTADKSINY